MFTIEINEECESRYDFAEMLRHVAKMLEDGYSSGIDPTWETKQLEK